jgi:hypothetical protein
VPDFPIAGECECADNEIQSDERCNNKIKTRTLSSAPPTHEVSSAVEIMHMLLYSKDFGSKEMAAVSDNEGRLPLHIILENIQWIENCDQESPHPIKSLIDANPYALECRDGLTGLYPFMISAMSSRNSVSTEDNDLAVVETTYRLLVASPAVLSICLNTHL